jgi:hypothetical protein
MQTFYMINCKTHNSNCYFSKGIHITGIPFYKNYVKIVLQKITIVGKKYFIYDLYPAFLKFLKAIKLYYKLCKNPKFILRREVCGLTVLPRFRSILQSV